MLKMLWGSFYPLLRWLALALLIALFLQAMPFDPLAILFNLGQYVCKEDLRYWYIWVFARWESRKSCHLHHLHSSAGGETSRSAKRVWLAWKKRLISPVGPLRCLATMMSAIFFLSVSGL